MAVNDPINPFDSEIDVSATNDQFDELGKLMMDRFQPDYDKNFTKYQERLSPYTYQAPNMSFYDLASELGAGLLATPNTGGASAFTGLGVGFANASERMKKKKEDNAKARQQIALQAAQMAMQDERQADEFLNQAYIKMIGDTNKEIKTMNLSWIDKDSGERKEGTLDKKSDLFKEIMSDPEKYGAQEITQPLVDMSNSGNMYERLNQNTADSITSVEDEWAKEAKAQIGVQDKIDSARYYAGKLEDKDFGPLASFNMGVGGIMVQLKLDGLIDEEKLGSMFAVNSVGTGLAMGLISQTKGAISDREMAMFLKASATIGNSKQGFLNILDITEKIAQKAVELDESWAIERARLQNEGVSLAEMRAAMRKFQNDFHKKNKLFSGSEVYNPDLSIEDNLKNMKEQGLENTEAYKIVSQMTKEGEDVYNELSKKHATYGDPENPPKKVSKSIKGVPDGSIEAGTYQNQSDPNDPNNGKTMYRSSNGKLYVAED